MPPRRRDVRSWWWWAGECSLLIVSGYSMYFDRSCLVRTCDGTPSLVHVDGRVSEDTANGMVECNGSRERESRVEEWSRVEESVEPSRRANKAKKDLCPRLDLFISVQQADHFYFSRQDQDQTLPPPARVIGPMNACRLRIVEYRE